MVKQRRRYARVEWLIPMKYKIRSGNNGDLLKGWGTIINIGLNGVQFATRFPVEAKQPVFLSFRLGNKEPFSNLPGQIVRISRQGIYWNCGVRFSDKVDRVTLENAFAAFFNQQDEQE